LLMPQTKKTIVVSMKGSICPGGKIEGFSPAKEGSLDRKDVADCMRALRENAAFGG
jgi:hypothetical protein